MPNKYKAVWVSYSSISDYLRCPRAYYLKNVYKNPKTGRKIAVTKPALSLGSAVHNVLEPLAKLDPNMRFNQDLLETFDLEFAKYIGKKGGFEDKEQFEAFRKRGHKMIERVLENKEVLETPTHTMEEDLLDAWLSKEEEIIICGKIDWIEKDTETGGLSVIDFKTNKEEKSNPLQLQIYALLLHILNRETVNRLNYWYLDIKDELTPTELPDVRDSHQKILQIALEIKEARENEHFECPEGGCFACRDFEAILKGDAERVGIGGFGREIYFLADD